MKSSLERYDRFLDDVERLMKQAHTLGLNRTAEKLHFALNEARSERFEAQPLVKEVEFIIGPVREQHL